MPLFSHVFFQLLLEWTLSPLHYASNAQVAELLLKADASPDVMDKAINNWIDYF